MDQLVSEFAVAIGPEPVPVVVNVVVAVLRALRGALPKVPIEIVRRTLEFRMTDRLPVAGFVGEPFGHVDLAKKSLVHEFHISHESRVRTTLGAVLDNATVLLGGIHQLTPFKNVVGKRFLDIDILASLATPDRGEGVPVVWSGDRDGIDGIVLHHLAHVGVEFGFFAGLLLELSRAFLEDIFVDIAESDHFAPFLVGDVTDVAATLSANADATDANVVVRSKDLARSECSRRDHRSRGTTNEFPSRYLHLESSYRMNRIL